MKSLCALAVLLFSVKAILGETLIGGCDILPSDDKYLEISRNMIEERMLNYPLQQDVEGCTTVINIDYLPIKKDCVWNAVVTFSFTYIVTTSYDCPSKCRPCAKECLFQTPAPVKSTCFAGTTVDKNGVVIFPEGYQPRCEA